MRRTTSLLSIVIALGIIGSGGVPAFASESSAPPSASPSATAPAEPSDPATPAPETAAPDAQTPETPAPDRRAVEAPAPEPSAQPAPSAGPDAPADAQPPVQTRALAVSRTVINDFPPGIYRLAGVNRYATSVAIGSRFQQNVNVVYVATGLDFPDALSSASAAAKLGGPLLLTQPDVLTEVVAQEIRRLKPAQIVVAGSEATITPDVFKALTVIAKEQLPLRVVPVTRLGGADRFETAEKIIAHAFTVSDQAYIATGRTFPDALAASAAAGALGAPVFLVDGLAGSVRPSTLALMKQLKIRTVRIAGDANAVSADIERELASSGFTVRRDQGTDRYSTAIAINEAVFGGRTAIDTAVIATGQNFADALSGAALAGQLGAPLYLAQQSCMSYKASNSMQGMSPGARVILGSTASVGDEVFRGDICHVWSKPANGRITDVFGPRTPICTPGGCTSSFHRGLDLGTGCWSPIYAAADGAVTIASPVGTFGNFVKISHGSGMDTGYAHLADGGTLVSVGQAVTGGQQIGWSGATGAATGCHLHFELYQNGTQIDPLPYLRARGVAVG